MKRDIKKFGALGASAVIAAAGIAPAMAFAAVEPSVDYTGGTGTNVTTLTLTAEDADANLADDNGNGDVKTNAKVQVPVAINFVAGTDGTITGPTDAKITNYSSYKVNVSNIKATATSPATLVSAANCDGDDEVYLAFKPTDNTTTLVDLSEYLDTATNDEGKAPAAGEWNIAAATNAGTAEAVGVDLALTNFTGKIAKFKDLDPTQKTEIGEIEWTVKAGTRSAS